MVESVYVLRWIWLLVFRPSFLVLRSPHVAERIFSDFIRKRLFEPERVYSTSDLGKILGKFNSAVQGRKLIIMNETRMAKDEWQKRMVI